MKTFPISFDLLQKFYYYDELSSEAKAAARKNIVIPEVAAHQEHIARLQFFVSRCKLARLKRKHGHATPGAESIHELINDRNHIKRLINGSGALTKIRRQGDQYLIPFIRANKTIYTVNGDYVFLDCETCMIALVTNETFYHLNEQQNQVARQPYVDVNKRGPAYHDQLYRMHDKIKRLMIR